MVALAFALTCRFPFLDWDDTDLVVRNPYLSLDWRSLERLWTASTFNLYTPLAYTVWAGVSQITERQAWAFHALNVLLHAAAAGVAYLLLNRKLGSPKAAVLGALMFGLHPLAVEPVAWVSGMNNILAGLLSLGAIATMPEASDRSREGKAKYALATFLFMLALFSKPTAVTVPVLALTMGLGWRRALPWLAMAAIFAVIGANAQPVDPAVTFPVIRRSIVALDAVGFYAVKTVFPVGLSVDYGRRPELIAYSGLHHAYFYVGAALVVAACLTRGEVRRGLLLFLLPLLPVLGLKSFVFQEISTVADRYAYLSLFGAAYLTALVARHSQAWRGTVIAAVPAAGLITLFSLAPWRDTASLFKHAMNMNPDSYKAPFVLGKVAAQDGNLEQAEQYYRMSLDRRDDPATHYNLGNLYYNKQQFGDAKLEYDIAAQTRLATLRSQALTNRGMTWMVVDDIPRAAADFEAAIHADPTLTAPYMSLARIQYTARPDEAIRLYRKVLDLDPNNERARAALDRLTAQPTTEP